MTASPPLAGELDTLRSRMEIGDVMMRYARGVDRLQWDEVRACFHPGAPDEHGDVVGTYEDMIAFTIERHKCIPVSQHFLGNSLIEFIDPNNALVETYFVAFQRMVGESGTNETDLDIIARYLDHFQRRESAWRVARRKVIFDSFRSRPSGEIPLPPHWLRGRRDESDPVYTFRCELEAGHTAGRD